MDHRVLIQLIISYTLVVAFVFTVLVTCGSLIGWVKFADRRQQGRLFTVLIVSLVSICLTAFGGFLELDPAALDRDDFEESAERSPDATATPEVEREHPLGGEGPQPGQFARPDDIDRTRKPVVARVTPARPVRADVSLTDIRCLDINDPFGNDEVVVLVKATIDGIPQPIEQEPIGVCESGKFPPGLSIWNGTLLRGKTVELEVAVRDDDESLDEDVLSFRALGQVDATGKFGLTMTGRPLQNEAGEPLKGTTAVEQRSPNSAKISSEYERKVGGHVKYDAVVSWSTEAASHESE